MAEVRAFSLATNGTQVHLAPELKLIVDLVDEGSRVLDLGCGRGDLLLALGAGRGAPDPDPTRVPSVR